MSIREVIAASQAPATARPVAVASPWRLVPDLARIHALRIVRSPAFLLGGLWFVLGVGIGTSNSPYERYSMVSAVLVWMLAVPAYFAVNLVATSGRRAGVDEWAEGLPMPELHRTVALLLAAAAPALVTAVGSLGYLALIGGDTGLPLLWQHVASPLVALVGAGFLAVAVSRLLPWPGLALVAVVAVVTANFWVAGRWPYLGAYVDFVQWTDTDAVPVREPGSAGWHLTYLLALCALAGAGALVPVARRRVLPFTAGAVAGIVVLVAGYLQLP